MPRIPFALLSLVLFALGAASPAAAQRPEDYDYENLAFRGLGVWVFGVLPARSETALAVQARADFGELGPNVRISPSITFWSSELREGELSDMEERFENACERSGTPCPGIDLGEVKLSDLSIDVDAHFLLTTDFGVEPYLGVGAGVHLVNGSGDFIDDTFVEDVLDAITPGLNVMAGIEIPFSSSLRVQAEARGVLASNARWVGVGIGGAWSFGDGSPPPRTTPAPPPPPPGGGR
jgi:hypothetical protein